MYKLNFAVLTAGPGTAIHHKMFQKNMFFRKTVPLISKTNKNK
jgi:hypothetical protein